VQWVLGTTNAIETIKVTASQTADFARALTAACSVCSIVYDRASGGAEHCQMGAQSLRHTDPLRLDCTHRLSDDGSKWRELNGLLSHSELPGGVMLLGLGALTLK